MGNACACFGARTGNGKRRISEPEVGAADRQGKANNVPSCVGYKKTAASAKYEASSTPVTTKSGERQLDVNDPELNLNIQTPILNEQEVEAFFVDAKPEVDRTGVNGPLGSSTGGGKATGSNNTHVEVFSLADLAVNPDAKTKRVDIAPAKTHITVFNLSDGDHSNQQTAASNKTTEHGQAAHIDMTAFIGQKRQKSADNKQSGTGNPATVSKEGDGAKPNANQKVCVTGGVTNFGFTPDEPSDNKDDVAGSSYRVLPSARNDNDLEGLDENAFFFGMESIKFKSEPLAPQNTECDREIAEIVSEIHTIEDKMCARIRRHTSKAKHASPSRGADEMDSNLYEDVLNNLKDVCVKVEDVLRKKGVTVSDGIPDDWLSLPDLSVVDKKYEKETRDAQMMTVNKVLETAKSNDDKKVKDVLDEYKRVQERLMRIREMERRKVLDKLQKKVSTHRGASSYGGEEEDERRTLESQYNELMKNADDDEEGEEVVVDDNSTSSYTYSDSENGSVLSYLDEDSPTGEDLESTNILKETLTHDIQTRMTEMTSSDFRSIMDIYRKERSSIRNKDAPERSGLKQSLWDKLEERRKHVDQSIHEGLPKITESSGSESLQRTTNKDGGVQCKDNGTATKSCLVNPSVADASTGTDDDLESILRIDQSAAITEQELNQLTQKVVALTKGHGSDVDKQKVEQLLKTHFENLNKIRESKEVERQKHRLKLMEKLKNRREAEETVNVEDVEKTIEKHHRQFAEEEKLLQKQCLESFAQRRRVTEEDVERALRRYKLSQEALSQHRSRQHSLLRQRLKEKLAARKTSAAEGSEGQETSTTEAHPRQIEQRIREMDEEFYESLLKRKQRGDISQEELARLIDAHLNKIDEFRKNIRQHVSRRRRERRQERSKEEISALVQENKEHQEQMQRLRKEERNMVEKKLREKLRKKKTEKITN